jgi:hypothetical protein
MVASLMMVLVFPLPKKPEICTIRAIINPLQGNYYAIDHDFCFGRIVKNVAAFQPTDCS